MVNVVGTRSGVKGGIMIGGHKVGVKVGLSSSRVKVRGSVSGVKVRVGGQGQVEGGQGLEVWGQMVDGI